DGVVADWLSRRAGSNDSARYFRADPGALYAARHTIDLARLEPQVAKPFSPDNVVGIEAARGQKLDGCFIGACTTTEEELALGALVLEAAMAGGAKPLPLPEGKRLVVPGDLSIQSNLGAAGLWKI